MKKSLKVIASAAMALSMFSSVALADTTATGTTTSTTAVKTSKDFKDLAGKDAALVAKIDALLAAGTFEGVAADSFGIDENMTRAQVAKVLTLIYDVKVDASVKTSSFSDVKADDNANNWAIPFIEAAKKAGLIDGITDTTFAPSENVNLGQFATLLVKGLGKKVDVTGTPWYKDAVDQAVSLKLLPQGTDGSKLATRADLVNGAFNGKEAFKAQNVPAQVSVASVKATGVSTVVVSFDRDVDTSKATLTLKRGTSEIKTTAKFADDKKSATLAVDAKIRSGEYTVTLGGLDASAIKTATGSFTAQDEAVQKIEFVSTSDTVAISPEATVLVKATNQYGENASFSGGNYTLTVSNNDVLNPKVDRTSDGLLKVKLDTKTNSANGGGNNHLQTSISVIPITIWNNDSRVSVTKNFTLGTQALVTKMDVGAVAYSSGSSINKSGETATFELKPYDQYGNLLGLKAAKDAIGADNTNEIGVKHNTNGKVNVIFNPYEANLDYSVQDFDNNDTIKARVSLLANVDKTGEYNVQVYMQGASGTTKIALNSTAVANKVQIGELNDVIAEGDREVYVPIVAYDANGEQLTTEDLTSDLNVGRIQISVSGAVAANEDGTSGSDAMIMQSGDHKGSIKLNSISAGANGVVTVTAYIATANASSNAFKNFTVNKVRVPDRLKVVNEPAKQIIAGGKSKLTVQVLDQYNKSMDDAYVVNNNGNLVRNSSGATTQYGTDIRYNVAVWPMNGIDGTNIKIARDDNASVAMDTYFDNAASVSVASGTYGVVNDSFDVLNDDYQIYTTSAATGAFDFTISLYKQVGAATPVLIDKVTRQGSIVNGTNETLTYSVNTVPALFNAKDNSTVTTVTYDAYGSQLTEGAQENPGVSKLAREIKITAKNAAGEVVAVPATITAVVASNADVALTSVVGGKGYVLGNKVGTANVAVSFKTAKGDVKTVNTSVTVKNDAVSVASIKFADAKKTSVGGTFNAFDFVANKDELTVTDNYGVEYIDEVAQKYNYLLGVTFSIANVRNGTVQINQYGDVILTPAAGQTSVKFDLIATSATGKSATISIEQ